MSRIFSSHTPDNSLQLPIQPVTILQAVLHSICRHSFLSRLSDWLSMQQEVGSMQKELDAAQREFRKTQQLLRQLERQLAKAHMTRKESTSVSQQLQVRCLKPVEALPFLFCPSDDSSNFRHLHALQTLQQKGCLCLL